MWLFSMCVCVCVLSHGVFYRERIDNNLKCWIALVTSPSNRPIYILYIVWSTDSLIQERCWTYRAIHQLIKSSEAGRFWDPTLEISPSKLSTLPGVVFSGSLAGLFSQRENELLCQSQALWEGISWNKILMETESSWTSALTWPFLGIQLLFSDYKMEIRLFSFKESKERANYKIKVHRQLSHLTLWYISILCLCLIPPLPFLSGYVCVYKYAGVCVCMLMCVSVATCMTHSCGRVAFHL